MHVPVKTQDLAPQVRLVTQWRMVMKGFLRVIGCYWYGLVLVSLIWSTSIDSMRERIGGTTILPYLLVWFAALIPGVVILYVAENMKEA